ncbi:glycylpeptide N-tetradecanoyltransferase, putative [Eimeria praecox]|uniref:Myristoyl-CoA:protein N-myristoyltransferase n=1 Tax=Eimeria praecox TaxID=51316 RepID=U6G285_9EIME|nr:glycylpeptide N-tetradecanoyltransferase, putative [Eimeria praecox]
MPQDCCSKEEETRQQPKSRGEETPATAASASVLDSAERASSKPAAATAAAAAATAAAAAAAAAEPAAAAEATLASRQRPNPLANAGPLAQLMRGLSLASSPLNSPHLFWDTQPIVKASEQQSITPQDEGPIDATKTVDDVRKEPYNLPNGFVWSECSVEDPQILDEASASPGFRV